jgi:hypothetical protein
MHTQHEECIFFFQLDGNIDIQSLEHCHIKSTWKQINFKVKSNFKPTTNLGCAIVALKWLAFFYKPLDLGMHNFSLSFLPYYKFVISHGSTYH